MPHTHPNRITAYLAPEDDDRPEPAAPVSGAFDVDPSREWWEPERRTLLTRVGDVVADSLALLAWACVAAVAVTVVAAAMLETVKR